MVNPEPEDPVLTPQTSKPVAALHEMSCSGTRMATKASRQKWVLEEAVSQVCGRSFSLSFAGGTFV